MSPHSRLRSPATEEDNEAVILLGSLRRMTASREEETRGGCHLLPCFYLLCVSVPEYQPSYSAPSSGQTNKQGGSGDYLGYTFIYTSSFFRLLKSKLVDLDCCLSIYLFIYLIYSNKIIKINVQIPCWMFYVKMPWFQNNELFLTDEKTIFVTSCLLFLFCC